MWRKTIVSMALAVCVLLGLANVAGSARASAGEVEAFVAPVVPVVDQPVELRLFDATVTEPEIPFSILQEGREVFRGTAAVSNGQATAEWTPQETGFYTARFESGGGRSAEREFPVVWTDLYFTTWGVLWPEEIRRIKYVHSHAIIAGDKNKRPMSESIPMLRKRGAKLIHFTSGSHRVPPGPMDDETIARLVAGWSAPIKNGFDGIFMDELGEWPTPELIEKLKGTHRALVRLRAENPEMIIMPANGGALLREEGAMYREAGAVALLQTYPTCFTRYMASHSIEEHIDHRIMVARNTDLIQYGKNKNTALVLLGTHVDAPHEEPIEPELEGYVRYIKKKAPEMRGIAFYGGRHGTMIETQDRLCLEYYIKPVVDVRAIRFSNYSPRTGQPVDVLMQVHNLGGMTARKIKAKVYASRLGEGKRTRIGEIDIEKIGCGYHDLEYRGEEGDPAPEFQEIDGNRYAVYPGGYNTVFLPRTTRSVTWVPKKKGYYQVVVEIEPSATDQYTLLDGARVEPILVR